MQSLLPIHIQFLRKLAAEDKHTHEAPIQIQKADLDQMVREGLLIEYRGTAGTRYTVTQNGARLATSFGDNPELEKIAVAYVVGKGYTEEQAKQIVKDNGSEMILRTKNQEEGAGTGQREVNMASEGGKPIFRPMKST